MKTARRWIPRLAIKLVILSAASASALLAHAQVATGVPWDWSHAHLIFSHPGTAGEALRNNTYDRWLTIANDPRYMIQLQKRIANATRFTLPDPQSDSDAADPLRNALGPENQQPAPDDALDPSFEDSQSARTTTNSSTTRTTRTTTTLPFGLTRALIPPPIERIGFDPFRRPMSEPFANRMIRSRIKKDWSETLGNSGTVGLGRYPATYTTGAASCNDFVVFSTGLTGTSSQASIIAFNNIYAGCNSGTPTVYWAYNTAGAITTSPVLSLDGSQIAFVQSSSSQASLVLLTWKASNGTLTSPVSPTSKTAGTYDGCTAPCVTTIPFSGSANDSASSPFPAYNSGVNSSTIYVGDDAGALHQFINIFNASGTPAENTTSPWPITLNSTTKASLASPVYDAVSARVFVGDYLLNSSSSCEPSATNNFISCGYLYSINSSGSVTKSAQLDANAGILDSPIVDSATGQVFAFIGDDGTTNCASSTPCAAIFQFPVGFSSAATGTEATVGTGYEFLLSGAFDNAYFNSSGTGHLYVVGNTDPANNTLYQIAINSGTMSSGAATAGPAVSSNYTNSLYAAGLQVTEFYAGGSNDYLFLSVLAYGSATGCGTASLANGCIIGYNVNSGSISGSTLPTGALAEAGGTSGIVVDNANSDAQNIYFSTLSNQTCSTSGGTGGCAIQTIQSAP
jgi:hypothetical protein